MLRGSNLPISPCLPAMPLPSSRGMASGVRQRAPIPSRGGQLQVAGVVVGQWGANLGYQRQQLVPAGYPIRGRGGQRGGRGQRGGGRGQPSFVVNNTRRQVSEKRLFFN